MLFAVTMQRQTNILVEQTLRSEAQLAGELLFRAGAGGGSPAPQALDEEADRLGALITARVTLMRRLGVVT